MPPGAGQGGVPHVKAGQTVTVYLGGQGVRFTQAGRDGVRALVAGVYGVRFGVRETLPHGQGFAEAAILVTA